MHFILKSTLAVTSLLVLLVCSSCDDGSAGSNWINTERDTFLEDCENGRRVTNSEENCQCYFESYSNQFSFEDFTSGADTSFENLSIRDGLAASCNVSL